MIFTNHYYTEFSKTVKANMVMLCCVIEQVPDTVNTFAWDVFVFVPHDLSGSLEIGLSILQG